MWTFHWLDDEIIKCINECGKENYQLITQKNPSLQVASYLSELGSGAFAWYPFRQDAEVLQLSGWFGVHAIGIHHRVSKWTIIEPAQHVAAATDKILQECDNTEVICDSIEKYLDTTSEKYDYVLWAVDEWRDSYGSMDEYKRILSKIGRCLKKKGHLLFVVPNRLGVKYLCGAASQEGSGFDGLTDDFSRPFRFTKAQLNSLLDASTFKNKKLFYLYPDVHTTQVVYTDEIKPTSSMRDKINVFHDQQTKRVLDEAIMINHLLENNLMNDFCNSFFVDLTDGEVCDIYYSAMSLERPRKHSIITAIHSDVVTKTAAYPEGLDSLQNLLENHNSIESAGVPVIPLKNDKTSVSMKYVDADDSMLYIRKAVREKKKADFFIGFINQFIEDMRSCSDESEEIHEMFLDENSKEFWGVCRKVVYTEMIPANSFVVNGRPYYYDQEYKINDCPEVYLLYRIVRDIYQGVPELNEIISFDEMLECTNLSKYWEPCRKIEEDFQKYLRQYDRYAGFWHWVFPSVRELFRNRSLISNKMYIDEENLFDIEEFPEEHTVVFGTGKYANKLLDEYGDTLKIDYFVDNTEEKWGTSFRGIEVKSPREIMKLPTDRFHVIVAIRDYYPILEQLEHYDVGRGCVRIYRP